MSLLRCYVFSTQVSGVGLQTSRSTNKRQARCFASMQWSPFNLLYPIMESRSYRLEMDEAVGQLIPPDCLPCPLLPRYSSRDGRTKSMTHMVPSLRSMRQEKHGAGSDSAAAAETCHMRRPYWPHVSNLYMHLLGGVPRDIEIQDFKSCLWKR